MKNYSKIIIALVIIVLLGATAIGIYQFKFTKTVVPEKLSTDNFQQIWGKKEIIIGLDEAYPPITFKNEKGEIVGYDVDLAKEVFKRMGLTPVFRAVEWDTIVLSLTKGDIDVVWSGMSINEERQAKINFSDPYFKGAYVYILKKDATISNKSELSGKTIGVQAGSSNEEWLRSSPIFSSLKELKTYSTFEEALLDLDIGRVDAVFGDGTFAYYYINDKKADYKTFDEIEEGIGAGVGIRKTDNALRDELNKTLREMKQDGTMQEIAKKWFGNANFVI
ncbi:MAG: amino acid ABC transporter substrate-binding protein [bacterium]